MNPGTRMFRQHDVAPTEVVSPLFRQLTQEWAELHAQTSTAGIVRRWGRAEPALAGFTRPGEILDANQQQGSAWKRKDDIYRMAQANKAFAHYRW